MLPVSRARTYITIDLYGYLQEITQYSDIEGGRVGEERLDQNVVETNEKTVKFNSTWKKTKLF